MSSSPVWLSVLTPNFNQGKYLKKNLDSVASQMVEGVEHIIVDGGSADNSISMLKAAGEKVRWISEPDKGQTDALAKALAMAQGDVIGWLNADEYYEPGSIAYVKRILEENPGVDIVYGDFRRIDAEGREIRINRQWPYDTAIGRLVTPIIQNCSAFFRKTRMLKVGGFSDTSLTYIMDWDLYIRMLRGNRQALYVPRLLGNFTMHPHSKTSNDPEKFLQEIRLLRRREFPGLADWQIELLRRWHYLRLVRELAASGILMDKAMFKLFGQRVYRTEYGSAGFMQYERATK